jgi:hypothetical protein
MRPLRSAGAAEREWPVLGATTARWTLLTPCGGRGPAPSGKTWIHVLSVMPRSVVGCRALG